MRSVMIVSVLLAGAAGAMVGCSRDTPGAISGDAGETPQRVTAAGDPNNDLGPTRPGEDDSGVGLK